MLIFHGALITGESGVARSSRKSHLGPAEIASFSSQDFSRNNKHDTFWHVSTGYFYVLWAIAFQIFVPWKFITALTFPYLLSLLQSTPTQITISIKIIIYFKNYTVWKYSFFKKYMLRFFIFIRIMVYRKKLLIEKTNFLFPVDYVKIIEFYIVQTWPHM